MVQHNPNPDDDSTRQRLLDERQALYRIMQQAKQFARRWDAAAQALTADEDLTRATADIRRPMDASLAEFWRLVGRFEALTGAESNDENDTVGCAYVSIGPNNTQAAVRPCAARHRAEQGSLHRRPCA